MPVRSLFEPLRQRVEAAGFGASALFGEPFIGLVTADGAARAGRGS
jgi:hypothetical protein